VKEDSTGGFKDELLNVFGSKLRIIVPNHVSPSPLKKDHQTW
jgi:hypothetical protein